jgi:hypothetical protein
VVVQESKSCRNGFLFTKKQTFKEYDNEFSDTDKSSDTDFGQQNDALYLDAGDESRVGDTNVSDDNFLWEEVDN